MTVGFNPKGKGWLKVPGIRPDGDRTLDEQMLGLAPALAEAKGKTILDLGCAEGLIGLEFAKAGAESVLGIELLEDHLLVARKVCRDYPNMRFIRSHLMSYIDNLPKPYPVFDMVLALGVAHKMDRPDLMLSFSAQSCANLLCFRPPGHAEKGVFRIKQAPYRKCRWPAILKQEGFELERTEKSTRKEVVEYWRRKNALPV